MSDAPLSAPPRVVRREVHLRRISCSGFAREDGLWDIEGHLVDTKPQPLDLPVGRVEAGQAIHEMRVGLTIDIDFLILDAWALTVHAPYGTCSDINPRYRQLVGLRIEPGFTQRVKQLFRATLGCSHLTELLPPMATTAFQVIWSDRANHDESAGGGSPVGGCHVLRRDGELVRIHYPKSYTPPASIA